MQKKSVDERILDEYGDIVKPDKQNPDKYICLPCQAQNKKNKSGSWYAFVKHINTNAHNDAMELWKSNTSEEEEEEINGDGSEVEEEKKRLRVGIASKTSS